MAENATQNTLKPTPKLTAVGIGGALGTILVAVANALGLDLPPEVASGVVAIISFGFGFRKRDISSPA